MTNEDAKEARQDMSDGYGSSPAKELKLRRRAATYRPEQDAEAQRIRDTYVRLNQPIPARLLLQLGMLDRAKAAAGALNKKEDNS